MPIFLDRHDLPGMSAEDNRRGASAGSRRAGALWRRFLTYWFDSMQGTAFCLVEAPDAETANRVHEEAHGGCVDHVIEIDKAAVYAFLGRVADPVAPGGAAARPQDFDSAYRAMMFTDIVGSGAILVSRELCDGPEKLMRCRWVRSSSRALRTRYRCSRSSGGSRERALKAESSRRGG